MKQIKYILLLVLGILILFFCFWFFHLRFERERKLMKEGYILVEKIESFKVVYGRFPESLSEMGLEEQEGIDALYYQKKDSLHYEISFMMSMDYNRIYYSKTKQWKDYDEVIE